MEPTVILGAVGDDPARANLYYGLNVLDALRLLPDESVNMVCTSPPYWSLRDYGVGQQVWGGDADCAHEWGDGIKGKGQSGGKGKSTLGAASGGNSISPKGIERSQDRSHAAPRHSAFCGLCGAWRGCLGLEPTPQLFTKHMVLIGREIRRVLHPTGTFWLNLGDSYMSHAAKDYTNLGGREGKRQRNDEDYRSSIVIGRPSRVQGLKDKDLIGIPWRVALALQGWWLRNDIIWRKTNAMPHPVRDRFTSKHEHIFMFAKSKRYFFDLDAVLIPYTYGTYTDDGFTPAQVWHESGDAPRKMDQTEGQLGELAGPGRQTGRGQFNKKGKNPGDIASFPEERERFLPLPGQCHAVSLGVKDFGNSAAFVRRVVDQLEDAARRVASDLSRTDVGQTGEPVTDFLEEFFRTRPVQPNLAVLRGTPYATITVEQAPDHIGVEFGRCRWVLRHEGLSGADSEKGQIVRHSFAVNGEGLDAMLVLVNWVSGLPLPSDVFDQLCVLRRKAHRDGCSPSLDAAVSDHQAKNVRHLRTPAAKVAFIEGLLAVTLHQARVAMPVPPLVVHPAPSTNTDEPVAAHDAALFHVPIVALQPHLGNHTGDVWDVATTGYKGAHFAVWPPTLVERFIKAGTSEKGRCPTCKTPWKRVVETKGGKIKNKGTGENLTGDRKGEDERDYDRLKIKGAGGIKPQERRTVGWASGCECETVEIERCVVLDTFSGSGTTGLEALRLGRDYVGLDLNAEYRPLAEARLTGRKAPQPDDEPDLIGELFG